MTKQESDVVHRYWLLGGVAAACLLMTALATWEVRQWSGELAQARFNEAAHLRTDLIENQVRREIDQLDSLRRFITLAGDLNADDLRQMVRLNPDYEMTVAWLEHVPADALDAYLERMRTESGPGFQVVRPGTTESVEAPERYLPITYYQTTDSDGEFAGVDPSELPGRMQAMKRAAQTGEPVMTTGIAILTDLEDLSGSLTFAPVYGRQDSPSDDAAPWANLRGFIGYAVRLSALLDWGSINPETGQRDFYFELLERVDPNGDRLLFSQFDDHTDQAWLFEDSFNIAGQELVILAAPVVGHRWAGGYPYRWVLGIGLGFTLLVMGIVRVLLNRNERVRREVADKTRALDAALESEKHTSASLQGILDAAEQVAIIATRADGLIRVFNIGAENILGYRASEMLDKHTPLTFHDPEEVEQERRRLMETSGRSLEPFEVFTFNYGQAGPATWTYIRRDGARRQVRLMVTPIRLAGDEIGGYLGVAVDVTEQIAAERELVQADQLLKALTRNVPGAVYRFRMDADGSMSFPYASDGIYQLYEISAEEARESAERIVARIHPDDRDTVMEMIQQSASNLTRWKSDYRVVLPSRGVRWLRGESTPEGTEDGATVWHGYLADITELKELEQKLRDDATIDPLTGLHNRRQLEPLAQTELVLFERTGEPFSLIMIDLDHFKALNDRYGHDIGDEVLRRVGTALTEGVRTSDVVFRLGGEEMLVLCPKTGLEGAVALAEKLRRSLRNLAMPFDGEVTASLGVATILRGERLSDVMKRADKKLYEAKKEGRNCVIHQDERVET